MIFHSELTTFSGKHACRDVGRGGESGCVGRSDLILTAIIDGPLTGGTPKAIEIAVLADVPDLSIYGIGVSNNGNPSSGVKYELSGSASAGTFLTVSKESVEFANYFGSTPSYIYNVNVNGNDVVELFKNDFVVDAYGEIGTDGEGEPWEYSDGFAYRQSSSTIDGTVFDATEWDISKKVLGGCTSNSVCEASLPLGSYAVPTTSPQRPGGAGEERLFAFR